MSHIVPFNEPIQSKVPIGRNIGEQLCSHFACLKKITYPLEICQIAIEHGTVLMLIYLLKMVIIQFANG